MPFSFQSEVQPNPEKGTAVYTAVCRSTGPSARTSALCPQLPWGEPPACVWSLPRWQLCSPPSRGPPRSQARARATIKGVPHREELRHEPRA